jgi:hypothetical protein
MSYVQYLEELAYDTETEYRNVLRQEAFDPYEFFTDCEVHETSFDIREGCPEFHEPVAVVEPVFDFDPADEPPF